MPVVTESFVVSSDWLWSGFNSSFPVKFLERLISWEQGESVSRNMNIISFAEVFSWCRVSVEYRAGFLLYLFITHNTANAEEKKKRKFQLELF